MINKRAKILLRVKALLAKTIDNGCTEAEAMSALNLAQSMMDAYEINLEDIEEIKNEKAIIDISFMREPHKIRWKLAYMIGKFTDTYTYGNHKEVKFVGLKSDVEFGKWLIEILAEFVRTQLKSYIWKNKYTNLNAHDKRIVINGFVVGCVTRINERLNELIKSRNITTNGKELMIVKQHLIDEIVKNLKIKASDGRGRKARLHHKSYEEGLAAGDKANFGKPIENKNNLLRLK